METFGLISLLPVLLVLVCAIITRKAFESLLLGTAVGAIIYAFGTYMGDHTFIATLGDTWNVWFGTTLDTIGGNAYYIVMFGMFGVLIKLLDDSGAALGFADLATKVASSRKKTMVATWILGIVIFIEDYLNALGVAVAMKTISDKYKISREMLAFIVNATGAAVCILVPISTWGALYSKQIAKVGLLDESGLLAYSKSIPYMLYAWIAVIVVPLFIFKVIPLFGPMKQAEQRALDTGKVFPDWYYEGQESGVEALEGENVKKSSSANFIVPMIAMVIITLWSGDILVAVIASVVLLAIMLLIQKRLNFLAFCDSFLEGFKDMLYVTMLVITAFTLQAFNDMLGLTPYVIDSVKPILSPALFPVVIFIVIGALAFGTGSFWGIAAISFPIMLPLADAMGVNIYVAIGTVAAATAFGSQACFYSDAVTVTAAATGIRNIDYARTALPLLVVPIVLAIIAYLILGFVMAP